MADEAEGGKHSGRSRFLSKSKWSKVFKENESPSATGKVEVFKLNEDVTDFLKPSTDRVASTRPKINIAVAQRWPETHEVKRVLETQGAGTSINGWTKPRRREGLVVGFVKTAPEVIGEGGDEASDPPREVSRMKSKVARSVSDAKVLDSRPDVQVQPSSVPRPAQYARDPRLSGGPDDRRQGYGIGHPAPPGLSDERQQAQATMRDPRAANVPHDGSRPAPMRRAQTHNEFSPPLQRKHQSPPLDPVLPHRPSLGRTPTGHPEESERQYTPSEDGLHHDLPLSRPTIKTSFGDDETLATRSTEADIATQHGKRDKYGALSPSSIEGASPAIRRQRDMTNKEGMAFRRASAIYVTSESPTRDLNEGFQPPADFYDALSRDQADALSPPDSLSRMSATSPLGQSPFVDPKYIERKPLEPAPAAKQAADGSDLHTDLEKSSMSQIGPPQYTDLVDIKRRSMEVLAASRPDPLAMLDAEPPPPEAQMQARPRRSAHHMPFESLRQQRKNDYQPSYLRKAQPDRAAGSMPEDSSRRSQDTPAKDAQTVESSTYTDSTERNAHTAEGVKLTHAGEGEHSMMQPRSEFGGAAQVPTETIIDMVNDRPQASSRSPLRDSLSGSQPSQSIPSVSCETSPVAGHRRPGSRDVEQQYRVDGTKSTQKTSPSPLYQTSSGSPHHNSTDFPMLGPTTPETNGPSPSAPRPADHFATTRAYQGQSAKSPMLNLRNEETARPGSAGSTNRGSSSPVPPVRSDAGAELALADFAGRVAHMRAVFSLTSEKERSADVCTPEAWLRTAIWWYLVGKAGLESLLAQRSKAHEPMRELLMQAHVDLAKAFWIVTGPLELYDMTEGGIPPNAQSSARTEVLRQSVTLLMSYLRTLSASIQKSQLMPPSQSLIQGQDTTIWVDYPRFTADAAAILGGSTSKALLVESPNAAPNALDVLPLGDTKDTFCYNRFQVQVTINTDDADTDRVNLPCIVTMVRHRRDYQISLLVSSQSDLINIKIAPKHDSSKGTTWRDVSWKASSLMIVVHLPRGFDLSIRMQERDFRSLWNLAEYSQKVESSLRPERDEKLVHETRLTELQYADSSGTSSFPPDKVRSCSAMVYERRSEYRDGSGVRKMHRGFRLLLVTSSGHKSLSYASHEVCKRSPLLFEFITDASANGTTAMILRVHEERRQCRILLVFPDAVRRNALYEVLNGLTVGPEEMIVGKMNIAGVNIEPATQVEGLTRTNPSALHALKWQRLGVTNHVAEDSKIPSTVESESLRVIARHASGCMTDRLNVGKGELLLRLPCSDKVRPSVQMLRLPQEDLTMSIDTRQCPQHVVDGLAELLRLVQEHQTIRTYAFATSAELHAFQAAVTGYTVKYDGIASTFAISRRTMVVSIHHKWQASNVRLQIVSQSNTAKILAFMEDFVHADALCFEVRSMDTFESVKGDSKGKKWAVKLKEAKFSLPSKEKGEVANEDKVRRRFVNLEGLDYAEEHEDITVGFDTEEATNDQQTATRSRELFRLLHPQQVVACPYDDAFECGTDRLDVVTIKRFATGIASGLYQKLTKCKIVDLFDEKSWDAAGLGQGDVVHLETPVNPTGRAFNIQAFSEKARKRGAVLTVDATFAPPPLLDPFRWGADFVMHSGTKYIGGHSDMLCGVISISKARAHYEKDYWSMFSERVYLGSVMGSLEGWLGVRSLRTYELRIQRQSENADRLVSFLASALAGRGPKDVVDAVQAVLAKIEHASLQEEDMGWLRQQMPHGFGPVFSIWCKDSEQARRLPSKLHLFHHATSLGGTESLIEWRRMSDRTVERELLRVSVGVEAWEDLRDDFVRGFRELVAEGR
ncbi:hypothetical protein Tdes44962_MAKER02409 [Teratosphaeria destructans]|uniref:Cystathionine gamma-synthase n=1 Tax=Teratosphaeria destructans TaxID=418781 RepID=A0A9W7W3I8_9PEZI|nr:hypothetical protein Tdes44962_MAKER02409 [Teratosphaeria destructans]